MKISRRWLMDFLSLSDSVPEADDLAAMLTERGLEVESHTAAAAVRGLLAATVLSVQPLNPAKKLQVCAVDMGDGKPVQIVCGAPNVAAGQRVVVAPLGARLGDREIQKQELRGTESAGMICSAAEIGLFDEADGILILPADVLAGASLDDYLQLNDAVLDINITPNRGDCLSHLGVAREVAAAADLQLADMDALLAAHRQMFGLALADAAADDTADAPYKVELQSAECPYYGCVAVRGTAVEQASPLWMQTRLHRCGTRCVAAAVDITNYIMLALGQPLHAFDLDKLRGGIVVRMARAGEEVALLDGQTAACDDNTLLIADDAGGVALGGVMGGLESAVTDNTQNVLLEGAHFHPSVVRGRALRYGITSEAAYRFERGVDPLLPPRALAWAAQLLAAVVGGKAGSVHHACRWANGKPPPPPSINTSGAAIRGLLGAPEIDDDAAVRLLNAVGIAAEVIDGGIVARPPSWRFDVEYPADLAEEVIRGWGYARLPETMPHGGIIPTCPPCPFAVVAARRRLAAAGFTETITYAFVQARWEEILNTGRGAPVQLQNPISAEMSVMRTTLIGGLLDRAAFNLNRKHDRIRLFEIGRCFVNCAADGESTPLADSESTLLADSDSASLSDGEWRQTQPLHIAGLCAGGAHPVQWGLAARAADFYDMRGVLEEFLHPAKPSVRFVPFAENDAAANADALCPQYLHPGQAAAIVYGDVVLGAVGALHPIAAAEFALRTPPFVFELSLEPLLAQRGAVQAAAVSHFPLVRRDLSVSASRGTPAAAVLECVRQAASGTAVCGVTLFDCYESDKIRGGGIFYGIRLTMQGTDTNLTDDDINRAHDAVVQALSAAGMELRH